jgi:hypothetical protein
MAKKKLALVLDKIGTVLGDRRFWVTFALPLLILWGVLPTTVNNTETVNSIMVLVQGIGTLLTALGLQQSWTERPPSGLSFKEIDSEWKKVKEALSELGVIE